jgi:hypothetical protein
VTSLVIAGSQNNPTITNAAPGGDRMRKVRALLVSTAVATAVLLPITTAPAQAESIRYAYHLRSDCYNGGNLGIQ